jgi:uncharacterized membrane protein (UPF0127 family)
MEKKGSGKTLRALNRTRGTVLCEALENATSFAKQSRGLLGRDGLAPGAGMLFRGRGAIPMMWMHMFFMRFAIDIVFLDKSNRVIRINHNLKPWRVSSVVFGARKALELEAGAAARSGTVKGDTLRFEAAK